MVAVPGWIPVSAMFAGNKGIVDPLVTDGGHGAVAGDERHIVIQGEQLVLDGLDQGVEISLGEIRAADGAVHLEGNADDSRSIRELGAGGSQGDRVQVWRWIA